MKSTYLSSSWQTCLLILSLFIIFLAFLSVWYAKGKITTDDIIALGNICLAVLFVPLALQIYLIGRLPKVPESVLKDFFYQGDFSHFEPPQYFDAKDWEVECRRILGQLQIAKPQQFPPKGTAPLEAMSISRCINQRIVYFIFTEAGENTSLLVDIENGVFLNIGIHGDEERAKNMCLPFVETDRVSDELCLPRFERKLYNDYDFFELHLSKLPPESSVMLSGIKLRRIVVDSEFCQRLYLRNCWVGEIQLLSSSRVQRPSIYIYQSKIKHIGFSPNCCYGMQIEDSYIAGISCTPPENGHPLTSLTFKGIVDLQPKAGGALDIQSFRNLRKSLEDRRNFGAAYIIRELELRNERVSQSVLPRFLSFLYDFSSAYGNSPERAAAWAAFITFYNGFFIGINGLYRIYQSCEPTLSNFWVAALCREDYISYVASVIFFGLQPIFDPFNFIRSDQIVGANTFWINLWLALSNIIVLALIGIIMLGIRRRMRE